MRAKLVTKFNSIDNKTHKNVKIKSSFTHHHNDSQNDTSVKTDNSQSITLKRENTHTTNDNSNFALKDKLSINSLSQRRGSKNPLNNKSTDNIIQSILNEKENEIKKLTNTEEISDFYEYNECCMEMIHTLKPICSGPPQISLPFANEIPLEKRLAVFDLDETLVHALFKKIDKAQYTIKVKLPSNRIAEIGLNIRPHWKEALDQIANNYFIVVYTASDHSYADSVLNFMDPNDKYFKYRLYRNNCLALQGNNNQKIYVKDLNIFKGIDLKDIVIIDNSLLSYAYHLNNGIPILPYYDSKTDFELIFLAGYLNAIADVDDLREANKMHIQLDLLHKEKEKEIDAEQEVTSDEGESLSFVKLISKEAESNDDSFSNEKILKKKTSLYFGDFLKEFNNATEKNKIEYNGYNLNDLNNNND